MTMRKDMVFLALVLFVGLFGYVKSEQGDYSTLGYNTPGGYSFWRVDTDGHFKPGYASTYDLGTAALPIRVAYVDTVTAATTTGIITGTTGSFSGTLALTGALTSVGTSGVKVSTSATSLDSVRIMGAVVTLSTMPATRGEVWFQTSDYLCISRHTLRRLITVGALARCVIKR